MKKYIALAIASLIFGGAFSTSDADASVTLLGATVLDPVIPNNNDFKSDLMALEFSSLVMADIQSNSRQRLTFYAHAAESGYNNSFEIDGTSVFTESNEMWDADGIVVGSINVDIGDIIGIGGLDRIRFTSTGNPSVDASLGEAGFGVFQNVDGGYFASDGRMYFGYDDDGSGPDDNHDDIIISARLTSVPEPTSLAIWASLVGLCVAPRRRKR
jgi:hypothetical protein